MNESAETNNGSRKFMVRITRKQYQLIKNVTALNDKHAVSIALRQLREEHWQDSWDDVDIVCFEISRSDPL